jgi:fibro-slime domain-containing protein
MRSELVFCLGLIGLWACSASSASPNLVGDTESSGGSGSGEGTGGSSNITPTSDSGAASGTPQECGKKTTGLIRDFKFGAPPDFEYVGEARLAPQHGAGGETGIVKPDLGPDRKPVYNGDPNNGTFTTTGLNNFNMWFNDVDGINKRALYAIPFEEQQIPVPTTCTPSGTVTQYRYENTSFFPIDNNQDWGWGNEGTDINNVSHNFSFTVEFHTQFVFNGCEVFDFSGDDDVWVFLNNKRAVDLGGIHGALGKLLDFQQDPTLAGQFGLSPGNTYNFDFFYTERHTKASDFKLTTTLAFQDCMVY